MSRLEIGRPPMTLFTISLCTREPTPCSCLSAFPLKYTLWPPSVGISPDFFHLIWHNPRMLHLYRSIPCKCSSTLPTALRVLTCNVAMVMSSRPRSLAPVAHLSFPPWCPTGNAVVVRAANDPVWIFYHSLLSLVVCVEHIFSPAMPTPLQTAGLSRVTFS